VLFVAFSRFDKFYEGEAVMMAGRNVRLQVIEGQFDDRFQEG